MAELAPADLPAAVRARFADDTAALAAINEVLVAARRYCGWHVSPVRANEVIELDGPGGHVLSLPTLCLNSVASVTELGASVDVSKLDRSRRKGTLTKPFGHWTCRDGAITATITHGYTEAEAADWRRAVIALVDKWSENVVSKRETSDQLAKKVDDIEYQWAQSIPRFIADEAEALMESLFSQFRILSAP